MYVIDKILCYTAIIHIQKLPHMCYISHDEHFEAIFSSSINLYVHYFHKCEFRNGATFLDAMTWNRTHTVITTFLAGMGFQSTVSRSRKQET